MVDAVAPDERIDPQEQLVVGKGFDEIIVAAAAVGVAHVGGLGLRREKQDRRDAVLPDLRAGGDTVHAGHHDVQYNEIIVRLRAHELHGAQTVFGLVNFIAARREQDVQNIADIRFVVHNEDADGGLQVFHGITSGVYPNISGPPPHRDFGPL